MIVVKTFKLPRRFYLLHTRVNPCGQVIGDTVRHIYVELDESEYDALLQAAETPPVDPSARATAAILHADPFPQDVPVARTGAPTLSERQLAVTRWLCLSGGSGPAAVESYTGAKQSTLDSLVHLGLVTFRAAGAREPLYFLTGLGRTFYCACQENIEPLALHALTV